MPLHRYFGNRSQAEEFASKTRAKGGSAKVIPFPFGPGVGLYEVEHTPVRGHVRGGRPVRPHSRRVVQRRL